jgi:hypothetical protein
MRGVDDATRPEIEALLHDLSTKKSYKIFPNNKILTYNKKGVIDAVHSVVTDAKTITVEASGLHALRITVTVLTPILRQEDGQALTEDGIIFFTKQDLHSYPVITIASSTTKTITKNGLTFTQVTTEDDALNAVFLKNLLDFSSKVSSLIFPVAEIFLSQNGDVTLTDERGLSSVLLVKNADMKKVWSTLVSAIDTDPLKTKLANDKENLMYLDVRFGNKVFYKFSDGVFQNGTSTAIMKPDETASTSSQTPLR